MARKPHGGILRALRTFAFFSVQRAIDMKVFQTLGLFAVHRAIDCSLRSPERKRVKIRHSCPTGGTLPR